jgi:hypothetical protein
MLPDEHLGILLDVIVDWCKTCVVVELLKFYHRHFFCNNKVAHKEVKVNHDTIVFGFKLQIVQNSKAKGFCSFT